MKILLILTMALIITSCERHDLAFLEACLSDTEFKVDHLEKEIDRLLKEIEKAENPI